MVGRILRDRFSVLGRIGGGGMGEVFYALQMPMDRPVALKVLHSEKLKDSLRFLFEAYAACRLANPHTVTIYDFDRSQDGIIYIAMEHVSGATLEDLMRDGPMPSIRVARIGAQIASALIEAHDLEIVHRDIKPENVMVVDFPGEIDFVKVLDFGIAKLALPTQLTMEGGLVGTPVYMAPEQAKAEPLDGRADIYALGALLYHMLVGQPPFEGDLYQLVFAKTQRAPERMSDRRDDLDIPAELEEIVMQMVATEPEDRPQTAFEVFVRLAGIAGMSVPLTSKANTGNEGGGDE